MTRHASPLRYPGGKQCLAPVIKQILVNNDLHDGILVEPFAGGAGASLRLLFDEVVSELILNDADPRVYAFWRAVLNQTDELVERIEKTPITIEQWRKCRQVYDAGVSRQRQLDIAFAVFFLNRCNRSGILMGGGPIGGYQQQGPWRLDARFNRQDLVARIQRVAQYKERISFRNLDAKLLLSSLPENEKRLLVFLDPPYFEKGQRLYLNAMGPDDHRQLADVLMGAPKFKWLLTYDNVTPIRQLYPRTTKMAFELNYSAHSRRAGKEVLILDPRLLKPSRSLFPAGPS